MDTGISEQISEHRRSHIPEERKSGLRILRKEALQSLKTKEKRENKRERSNMEYNNKIREGQAKISRTVSQWNDAREKVVLFDNNPTRNIIA